MEMFYRQATDGSDVASFNIIKYLDNLITGKLCTGDRPSSSLPYASYFANMSDPVTKGNCEDDFADLGRGQLGTKSSGLIKTSTSQQTWSQLGGFGCASNYPSSGAGGCPQTHPICKGYYISKASSRTVQWGRCYVVDGVAAGAGSNGKGNDTAAGDGATSASPTACYIEPEAPVIVAEPEVEAFPLGWRNQLTRAVFFLLRLLVTPLAAYRSMKQRAGRGKSAYRSAGYVGRGKREGERRKRGIESESRGHERARES